jgi:hypothetical protein
MSNLQHLRPLGSLHLFQCNGTAPLGVQPHQYAYGTDLQRPLSHEDIAVTRELARCDLGGPDDARRGNERSNAFFCTYAHSATLLRTALR